MRRLPFILLEASLLVCVSTAVSADTYQPDNTGVNKRDRNSSATTPFDQSNARQDLEVSRKIREAIDSQDQLSTYAHNVKIITDEQGKVTLRGPVRNDGERKEVERIARTMAGNRTVVNELEIAPVR